MKKAIHILTLLAFSFTLFSAQDSFAKKKKRRKKRKNKSQWAYTVIDGAAVYQDPNFDSEILTYLPEKKKFKVGIKKTFGITGFGSFYKIKYKRKKYGYISDVDIKLKKPGNKEQSIYDIANDDKSNEGMPLIFNQFIGAYIGTVNLTEEYEGQKLSSQTNVVGFKMTGPDLLLPPPLDYELVVSTAAPAYFSQFASKTSGLFFLAHLATNTPFISRKSFYAYYGFGITALFTMFKNTVAAPLGEIDNQKLVLGVDIPFGVAFKLGKSYLLKLESKFYIEQQKYFGFGLSLQKNF